jgi:hypothetical protein
MFEGISGDVEVVGTSIKDKTYPKRPSRRGPERRLPAEMLPRAVRKKSESESVFWGGWSRQ